MTTGNTLLDGLVSYNRKESVNIGKVDSFKTSSFVLGAIAATASFCIFTATEACTIKEISINSGTGYALHATDFVKFGVVNGAVGGAGTTKVVDSTVGTNSSITVTGAVVTANVPRLLTLTANLTLAAGESLIMTVSLEGAAAGISNLSGMIKFVNPDTEFTIFTATQDCNVQEIGFVNKTAFAIHGTNYLTFGVVNKGLAGTGTTKVVDSTVLANKTFTGGTSIVANIPMIFTNVAANLFIPKGSSLVLTIGQVGTVAKIENALVYVKYKGAI